jgi:ATP-binding cassette subfamily F protein 3
MLVIENLKKQWGPQVLFHEAEMSIYPGERVGLVGPNGAGKTTLFRMIQGTEEIDGGTLSVDDWATVATLSQESQCRLGITVREEMESAFPEIDEAQASIEALSSSLGNGTDSGDTKTLLQLSQAQTALEMTESHTIESRIGRVLKGLGFENDAMDRLTDEFSGGWQMRIAMAKILLREPDLLLLDEPTNHLDSAAVKWLLKYLEDYHGAVFVISHEPKFLNAMCERIIDVDNGALVSYTGNYDRFVRQKAENIEHQQAAYDRQQRELERQQEFINRFGAKATKASQVKSREKQLEKIELIEAPIKKKRDIIFQFPEVEKSAIDVLRLKDVSKTYEGRQVLKHINLKIKRGDRIALLGPNGAGKSTLLRLFAGIEAPDEGGIRDEGRNVLIGYFAQHQAEALNADRTVLEEVMYGLDKAPEKEARGLLGKLLIRGDEVFKQISVLSGGERSRVALAKFLMQPANTLLLDEPTNHLDPASREVLQEAVAAFEGTVLMVSHDLPFITATAKEAYRLEDGVLIEEREMLVTAPDGSPQKNKKGR